MRVQVDNLLIFKFIIGEWRKTPGMLIKGIILLIPIISIVGMFSTVFMVEAINQNIFLRNSDYDWIAYFDDKPNHMEESTAHLLSIKHTTIGNIISFSPSLWYRPHTQIELFILDNLYNNDWSQTYFNNKNLHSGSFKNLTSDDDSLGIIVSYNVARSLGKDIGDKVHLLFKTMFIEGPILEEDELPRVIYYPVKIQGILKPFLPIGRGNGLGLVLKNHEFLNFLTDHQETNKTNYQYAIFGSGEQNFTTANEVIYKELQRMSLINGNDYILIMIAFGGVLVVYLLISREIHFILKERMRSIGILLALGSKKETIYKALWIEQIIKIILISAISSIIYKYLIMEKFIGQYINPSFLVVLLASYLAIGLVSMKIVMRGIKTSIRGLSVVDIVSKKLE